MKIVYLITMLDGGGAALPVADLVAVMREAGHDVTVTAIVHSDDRACGRLAAQGVAYRFLGDRKHRHVRPFRKLLQMLREERPDLIWTSMIQATVYGQLAGSLLMIPVVSWQHNAFLKPSNRRILRLTRPLTLRWIADSDAVARFTARALSVPPAKIEVWPLIACTADQPLAGDWRGDGPFRFGSLGRLHPNKGYAVLIDALAILARHHPDTASRITVTIAGSGKQEAELKRHAAESGVSNLRFVGFHDDAFGFLAGLHGYVQPSRNEGLCIAAHEAMNAGLPVISTPVGELATSVVPGETGLLIPIGDAAALAEALLALVADPVRARAMGAAARELTLSRFGRRSFVESGLRTLGNIQRDLAAL